ncbi:hypothetical protein WA171_002560 [Blastocystis sp. BT1]
MPLDNESSEFRSGAFSPYDDDNPLVVIPSDLKTNVKDLEPKSASPCNSEPSVLRVPAPAISGTKMSSIREGVIQRQKPIARYSPTLNVTIGNVSVSLPCDLSMLPSVRIVQHNPANSVQSSCCPTITQGGISSGSCSGTESRAQMPFLSAPLCPAIQVIQPVFICNQPPPSPDFPIESLPVPPVEDSRPLPTTPSVHCTCTKTHCLKLYCECLKAGQLCSLQCGCVDCHNRENSPERAKVMKRVKRKRRTTGKVDDYPSCACQKSLCNKRYCSCYQSGHYCSEKCQCVDCHNRKRDYCL